MVLKYVSHWPPQKGGIFALFLCARDNACVRNSGVFHTNCPHFPTSVDFLVGIFVQTTGYNVK